MLGALAALRRRRSPRYVLTNNTVKQRQAELAGRDAAAPTWRRRGAPRSSPTPTSRRWPTPASQTVNDLAAARFDWEQALRDLSRAIPADVTLLSAQRRHRPAGRDGGRAAIRSAARSGAGDHARRLHAGQQRRRPPDGAPARRRRRHPRRALEVRASRTRDRGDRRSRRRRVRQGRAPELRASSIFFERSTAAAELAAAAERQRAVPNAVNDGRRDRRPARRRAGRGRQDGAQPESDSAPLRLDHDHHLDHDRGHAVTRTKILIPAVVAVAAVAAFWFLVLAPKREEIAKLDADDRRQAGRGRPGRAARSPATRSAQGSYKTNYATVARLGKAVPARRRRPLAAGPARRDGRSSRGRLPLAQRQRRRRGRRRRGDQRPTRRARAAARARSPSAAPASRRCRSRSRSTAASSSLSDFFAPARALRDGPQRATSTSPAACCCSRASRSRRRLGRPRQARRRRSAPPPTSCRRRRA